MLYLLKGHLGSKLFHVLIGLLKNLEEAGVLLGVNHVDVGLKVILLQRLDTIALLFVFRLLLLLFLRFKATFNHKCLLLDIVDALFVELTKVLGMEKDLIQKLSMPRFLPELLPAAHLLLKAV
jgi:hypothetical protein